MTRFPPAARARALAAAGPGAAVLLALVLAHPPPAHAVAREPSRATPVSAGGVSPGNPLLGLLGQTPWVEGRGTFRLHLAVSSPDPATDRLEVLVYGRLTNRSDFDSALAGNVVGTTWYTAGPLPLSALPADGSGGVDVAIPVNEGAPAGQAFQPLEVTAGSGVYPVQAVLYSSAGAQEGRPLTVFLVFAAGPPSVTNLPRLSVAVVLPFHSPPEVSPTGGLAPLPGPEAAGLAALAGVLAGAPGVPVTLDATPQTVDALSSGDPADRATAAELRSAVRDGPDEVLFGPYVRVSLGGLRLAGLDDEESAQLAAGQSALARTLGVVPSPKVWVRDGTLDEATLSALSAAGATRLVVPAEDLSALPAAATQTTFALPTALGDPAFSGTVYAADAGLTSDFTGSSSPVLAANQLLAELAMIQLETPGITRGVVAMPPADWLPDPAFVSTLLAGLSGHPLLGAVTVSSLFSEVPTAPITRQVQKAQAAGPPPARSQAPSSSPGAGAVSSASTSVPAPSTATTAAPPPEFVPVSGTDASAIRAARREVTGLAAMLPSEVGLAATLRAQLLVAESSELTEAQRYAILASLGRASSRVTDRISLPGPSSITITSTRSQVPLTILSAPSLHIHVLLQLTSDRLIFHVFSPPGGECRVPTPTSEICLLVLRSENTTLTVPVETRSSGVFPLDVTLSSPDGSQVIARDVDTVRSTAISGVGLVLIIVGVLSLALWWARDLRHGRRARRLVPAPSDAGDGAGIDVDEFLSSPPPAYEQRRAP